MSLGFWSRSIGSCIKPFATRQPLFHVRHAHSLKPANVVRTAVQQEVALGNVRGAIDVVNAALISDRRVRQSDEVNSTVEFAAAVSARLPFHTLVHGLLRAGLPYAAAEQVDARMYEGVKVRLSTLNAVVVGLLEAKDGPSASDYSLLGSSSAFGRENEKIQSEFPKLDKGTRTAIQLMRTARRTRNGRNNSMFDKIIDACLLQGEIVVGSLLFALLVRDWQIRRALATNTARGAPETKPHGDPAIDGHSLQHAHIRAARQIGLDKLDLTIPRPQAYLLQRILNHIVFPGASQSDKVRLQPKWKPPDKKQVLEMKRATYYLAKLLDQRQLNMDCLANLLKTMSNVPQFPPLDMNEIVDGTPALFDVYEYCHETIWKFSQTLPDHYMIPSSFAPSMIKPPDVRTYNNLLNYVLLHRMDVDAAHRILEHMCIQRRPQILPTIVTFNTIMRRATLLRRNDIVDKMLDLFRTLPIKDPALLAILESRPAGTPVRTNQWRITEPSPIRKRGKQSQVHSSPTSEPFAAMTPPHMDTAKTDSIATVEPEIAAPAGMPADTSIVPRTEPNEDKQVALKNPYPENAFGHALWKLAVDKFEFPAQIDLSAIKAVDSHTLSSWIVHLTSTNQNDRAVEILYALIPQLSRKGKRDGQYQSVRQSLYSARTQGALLGPYFFSTILNALRKSGKTGLAERVWFLAQLSEAASWDPDPAVSGGATPWTLDITAYTAMLQCYESESQKGAALVARKNKDFVVGWGYYNWLWEAEAMSDPSIMAHEGRHQGKRSIAARQLGMILVESMRVRAATVWRAFEAQGERSPPTAPVPDARFFNVLLNIYGRLPYTVSRGQRAYRQRWEKKYARAVRRHAVTGWLPDSRDPMLERVAEEMARHGLELPLGLRQAVIGRSIDVAARLPQRIRPRRFPANSHQGFRAFQLEVTKDRGLPIGYRQKRWQMILDSRGFQDDWGRKFERERTQTL